MKIDEIKESNVEIIISVEAKKLFMFANHDCDEDFIGYLLTDEIIENLLDDIDYTFEFHEEYEEAGVEKCEKIKFKFNRELNKWFGKINKLVANKEYNKLLDQELEIKNEYFTLKLEPCMIMNNKAYHAFWTYYVVSY